MFEYIWASPSRKFAVKGYDPYTNLEAATVMSIEERNRSGVSMYSDGGAPPALVDINLIKMPSPSKFLRRGPRKWFLHEQANGKSSAFPVVKDIDRVLEDEVISQQNGYDSDGYRVWNEDPRVCSETNQLYSDSTPSFDAVAPVLFAEDSFSPKKQMPSAKLESYDNTACLWKNPFTESTFENLTATLPETTPEAKDHFLEKVQDRTINPQRDSEKWSKAVAGNELTSFPTPIYIEDTRDAHVLSEDRVQNLVALPITPPVTPDLDFKDQQAFFEAGIDYNHPTVAREQFHHRQGVLWDGASHLLQRHFLHPADLTEDEFVTLVCSQGNQAHKWLESNVMSLVHRSVRRWMDAHSLLSEAGVYQGTVSNDFIHSFEWMSDEEQLSYIREYHMSQLRAVANAKQFSLSAADIEGFAALPITTRTLFIKQQLAREEPESEVKENPAGSAQLEVKMKDIVSALVLEVRSESSSSSGEYGGWATSALQHMKPLRGDCEPVVDEGVSQHLDNIENRTSHWSTLPSSNDGKESTNKHHGIGAETVPSTRVEVDYTSGQNFHGSLSQRQDVAIIKGTRLAHEVRALEIRTRLPTGMHSNQFQNTSSKSFEVLKLPDQPDIDNRKESLGSGTCMRSSSLTSSSYSSETVSSFISTEPQKDILRSGVFTPTKAVPTPRKATPPRRKLTPILDTTPYPPKSIRFHLSSASTASIDTTMPVLSRTKTVTSCPKRKVSFDYYDEDCSIFNDSSSSESQEDEALSEITGQTTHFDSSWKLKSSRLRRRLSQVMLGWKGMEVEKVEQLPQSLRRKISRVWGTKQAAFEKAEKQQKSLRRKISHAWGTMSLRSRKEIEVGGNVD